MSYSLAEHDLGLIYYLREMGVARLDDLITRFFNNYNHGYKRITRLKERGFLTTRRMDSVKSIVPVLQEVVKSLGLNDQWRRSHLVTLSSQIAGKSEDLTRYASPVFWCHQLMTGVIYRDIEQILPREEILAEGSLAYLDRIKGHNSGVLPDLAVHHDGKYFAIECERSKKSKKILERKLDAYSRSKYDKVLYLCATPDVEQYLQFQAAPYDNIYVSSFLNRNKFVTRNGTTKTLREFFSSVS